MRTLKKWRVSRSQDKMFLCTAGRPKFVPYSALMRPLFAILSLLLSLIATRADDLPVIKDSEAAQYIGKKRRSSRFGRLRHDQPTRDRIYQFRTRISQTDVRWVHCAGSNMATDQQIATLQGKIIGITGTVELHEGKPEIKVTSASQIKGADSQQAR
jgi:hypothetical protein